MNSDDASVYTLRIHREPSQRLWAEVAELPAASHPAWTWMSSGKPSQKRSASTCQPRTGQFA